MPKRGYSPRHPLDKRQFQVDNNLVTHFAKEKEAEPNKRRKGEKEVDIPNALYCRSGRIIVGSETPTEPAVYLLVCNPQTPRKGQIQKKLV